MPRTIKINMVFLNFVTMMIFVLSSRSDEAQTASGGVDQKSASRASIIYDKELHTPRSIVPFGNKVVMLKIQPATKSPASIGDAFFKSFQKEYTESRSVQ